MSKIFASRFQVYWCGNTISYSRRSRALRVGNKQVSIDEDELSDLENADAYDISTPVGIYKRKLREARGE